MTTTTDQRRTASPRHRDDDEPEPRSSLFRCAVAEYVGTALLVLTGTAVACAATLAQPIAGAPLGSLAVAASFGLALALIVAALGHVSGAHVNPAVTLGLACAGRFPWKYAPAYWTAQFAGAVTGACITWAIYGNEARATAKLGATVPADPRNWIAGTIAEVAVTFLLVLVVVSVATDDRAHAAVAPLAAGAALACGVLIAGPITGGAVNPARALGPLLVSGTFTWWWLVYLLAPLLGALEAGLLYVKVLEKGSNPSE